MSKCRLFFVVSACIAITGLLLAAISIHLADHHISRISRGSHFDRLEQVPPHEVALVLGCSELLRDGRSNLYFRNRIETAAKAYHEGLCQYLIVSGDNGRKDYNEPESMRNALVQNGVPDSAIYEDYAGFRTLDSVLRAREIFGRRKLLVISQQFHNERAIYIGKARSMELTGLNAPDVDRYAGWKTRNREKLARLKSLLDLHVLNQQPRFLGEPIAIGYAER